MNRPIRVLELRSVFGTGGGPEKTILQGAALADPARYAVTVCYIRDLRDQVFAVDRRALALGVDYVEITERHSFDFAIWGELRALVRERRIHVVHSHDYKTNFYAWRLSRAEPIVPLATLHGYTGHSWRETVYYAVDKRLVRRFPKVITVSSELAGELVRLGAPPRSIVRILNGIDDDAFRADADLRPAARRDLGVADGDFVIGGVGRLARQKRFDILIDAVVLVRQRTGRPVRLIVVGDGELREALQQHAARAGLGGACHFTGHRDDIAFLHHAFDLFVQSSDYEGTPNAVLEAMALETPIVATDVGGTREIAADGEHALLVPPGDPVRLADAVEQCLARPAETAARVRAARRRIELELSFRKRMAAVEAVYEELASQSTSSR